MAAAVLRELLGHAAFRPYQEACIARLLAADDVLAILPTGGGKSVIYQVPALLRHAQDPELQCLVVAPLVSLIADQMSALNARLRLAAGGIRPRAGGPGGPVAARFAPGARAPFLFITPEALRGAHEAVGALRLSLLVVDEAHCISAHGRAFREAYRELTCLRALHPTVPLCALTATASAGVGRDVALQLGLRGAAEVRAPLDRANLRLSVVSRRQLADDVGALLGHLSAGQGIVYFPTQREVERGAQLLAARGLDVAAYHAGLDAAVRQAVQERFVAGTLQCMAATLAFGMGVDVPGVRCIVHYGLPGALESYVQEIGRAGRDGAPAACVLFWTGADACTRTRLAQSSLDPALAGQGLREMLAFVQAGRCGSSWRRSSATRPRARAAPAAAKSAATAPPRPGSTRSTAPTRGRCCAPCSSCTRAPRSSSTTTAATPARTCRSCGRSTAACSAAAAPTARSPGGRRCTSGCARRAT